MVDHSSAEYQQPVSPEATTIAVDHLARRFDDVEAVRDVSFEVAAGEVFGLLGPNGAGKTTTIAMLCTLLTPTAGTAAIAGFDIVDEPQLVRRSIGLVFQQSTLDETLTAEQNLRFHAYAYGMPANEREDQMQQLLTLVGLWDRRSDKVATFSGGMRRRLEIARGLLHHPRVLFLDEPTLGLDPQTRRRIWEYVTELRDRHHLTILLTTHYMDEADNCDRIAVIDQGQIVALDTPDRLKEQLGGDLITITTPAPRAAAEEIQDRHGLVRDIDEHTVTFQVAGGKTFLPEFVRSFTQPMEAISLRPPTLDDVFLKLTGRDLRDDGQPGTRPFGVPPGRSP